MRIEEIDPEFWKYMQEQIIEPRGTKKTGTKTIKPQPSINHGKVKEDTAVDGAKIALANAKKREASQKRSDKIQKIQSSTTDPIEKSQKFAKANEVAKKSEQSAQKSINSVFNK